MNIVIQKFLTLALISLSILFCIKFSKRKLSLTVREKEEGYRIYIDLGLKFKLPNSWKEYKNYIIIENLGDIKNENDIIYGGKRYSFSFNEIVIALFSIIVFRENKLTSETELSKITHMNYNKNISNISGYSFYFCASNFIDMEMPKEEEDIYKSMYNDIENIFKSMTTYKPLNKNTSQKRKK